MLISIYFSYNGLDDKCAPILKDYLSTNTVLEVLKLNVSTTLRPFVHAGTLRSILFGLNAILVQ